MNSFLEEIFEQPEAIENALIFYTNSEGEDLLKRVKKIIKNILYQFFRKSFLRSAKQFAFMIT